MMRPKAMGHGRLLYRSFPTEKLTSWFDDLLSFDHFLSQHPRLFAATTHAYLYFFSWREQTPQVWLAKEVVGFESRLPPGFAFFDVFAGQLYEAPWQGPYWQDDRDITEQAKELALSWRQDELSDTWRLKLHDLDNCALRGKGEAALPKISFQFFKSL